MTFNAHIIVDIYTFVFVFAFEFVCDSAFVVMMITIMMTIMLIVDMDMACQNIPTMTKSHHGGEMSIMIKVGMCPCQIPTIHDKLQLEQLALVSCSTRPQC